MADTKANGAVTSPTVTKAEAVRRALTDLGHDATAAAIQKYVRDKFGYAMTIDHIYNAKSEALKLLRKGGAAKGSKPKKAATPKTAPPKATAPKPAAKAVAPVSAPSAAKTSVAASGVSLADIAAVKALIGRVGAGQLHGLIDLLVG